MARFHGFLGYVQTEKTAPGVYAEVATERACTGDIIRSNQRWENSGAVNDNPALSNQFRVIGNAYAFENLQRIRYIVYMGTKWKVQSIEIQSPHLVISVGGVYNGQ